MYVCVYACCCAQYIVNTENIEIVQLGRHSALAAVYVLLNAQLA